MSIPIDYRNIGRVCPSQIVSTPDNSSENHLYFVDRQADPELYNRPFYDHQSQSMSSAKREMRSQTTGVNTEGREATPNRVGGWGEQKLTRTFL